MAIYLEAIAESLFESLFEFAASFIHVNRCWGVIFGGLSTESNTLATLSLN